jgi:transposase-like protein|tara:strand:+ start:208 stop:474 length:267 start_codon:yes stop_codon:yes gene_type:complete
MATTKKTYHIAKDIKEQILKRVREEGIPVSQAAQEHGISDATIYSWLTKGASGNPSWTEVAKLKKENKMLLELVGEITVKLSTAQKKS